MKRYLFLAVGAVAIIVISYFVFTLNKEFCAIRPLSKAKKPYGIDRGKQDALLKDALLLLKTRKDNRALEIFEKILLQQPDNIDAFWGKAEVLRRRRDYEQAEEMLNKILSKDTEHIPSLISIAYIRVKEDKLKEALQIVNKVLESDCLNREYQALAHMLLGTINSRLSSKGSLFSKIKYGTKIKCYFLTAQMLAPDLPEVHLGLGTFYLLAPAIFGGNSDKAIEELELAVKIAPDFATANARLAQAYKKKNKLDKYNFYLSRVKNLDPDNEVLKELYN